MQHLLPELRAEQSNSATPWHAEDVARVAILIPCYNEAASITTVVRHFHRALPFAEIYVYDNNSTDGTAVRAWAAGAVVHREVLQGKGSGRRI